MTNEEIDNNVNSVDDSIELITTILKFFESKCGNKEALLAKMNKPFLKLLRKLERQKLKTM